LGRRIVAITSEVQFILSHPGQTDTDRRENGEQLARLRGERARLEAEVRKAEKVKSPALAPSKAELKALIEDLCEILTEVATSNDHEALVRAHRIVRSLTGGSISVAPANTPGTRQRWLRGTFTLNSVTSIAAKCGLNNVTGEQIAGELRSIANSVEDGGSTLDAAARAIRLQDECKLWSIVHFLDRWATLDERVNRRSKTIETFHRDLQSPIEELSEGYFIAMQVLQSLSNLRGPLGPGHATAAGVTSGFAAQLRRAAELLEAGDAKDALTRTPPDSTGADEPRCAPMSLTEIARRYLNRPKARARDVKELLRPHGLRQEQPPKGRKWTVCVTTMDRETRRRLLAPLN
jgi:hypothetical protein